MNNERRRYVYPPMKTTANEFCVEGRFWTMIPTRSYSEEEKECLRELLALAEQEEVGEESE